MLKKVENLAGLEQGFLIHFELSTISGRKRNLYESLKWGKIFSIFGPSFLAFTLLQVMDTRIEEYIREKHKIAEDYVAIAPEDSDTIRIQFLAHGYLEINGGMPDRMQLTEAGKSALLEIKSVRAAAP